MAKTSSTMFCITTHETQSEEYYPLNSDKEQILPLEFNSCSIYVYFSLD